MRILLIEDQELVRAGMCMLLESLDRNAQVTQAGSLETIPDDPDLAHDIILLDYNLPGVTGLGALAWIRQRFPGTKVVTLSGSEETKLILDVIAAGAAGFIPKTSSPQVMIAALHLTLVGGIYLPPQAMVLGTSTPHAVPEGGVPAALRLLTARQMDALKLAIKGNSNKLIARALDVSEATVKAHLSAAFRALGVTNRTEAVYAAARAGITT